MARRRLLSTLRPALLLIALLATPAAAQSTSSSQLPAGHTPRGALWRAAVAPGWGQIYNRQYVKLPFVWAGLGGLLGGGVYLQRRVVLVRRAYRYADWYENGKSLKYADDRNSFLKVIREQGIPNPEEADPDKFEGQLRRNRENTKRSRNLLFIASGLYYALTVLDAYVSAHLLDFDVGEDLTVRMGPGSTGLMTVRATMPLGR